MEDMNGDDVIDMDDDVVGAPPFAHMMHAYYTSMGDVVLLHMYGHFASPCQQIAGADSRIRHDAKSRRMLETCAATSHVERVKTEKKVAWNSVNLAWN